jgi:Rieske Fe-S protein
MEKSRREFIKKALYGMLALLGLGFMAPGIKMFSPLGERKKELIFFPLVPEDDIPRSGVKKGELVYTASGRERKARVFIVSSYEKLTVLSATCSHLGCLVNYSKEKGEFLCPCHGGRYDLNGKNIAGPPPAPLSLIPAKIENGMVLVGIRV